MREFKRCELLTLMLVTLLGLMTLDTIVMPEAIFRFHAGKVAVLTEERYRLYSRAVWYMNTHEATEESIWEGTKVINGITFGIPKTEDNTLVIWADTEEKLLEFLKTIDIHAS